MSHSLLITLLRNPLPPRCTYWQKTRTLTNVNAMSLRKVQLRRLLIRALIMRIAFRLSHQKRRRDGERNREDESCIARGPEDPRTREEAGHISYAPGSLSLCKESAAPPLPPRLRRFRRHNTGKQETVRVRANYSYCEASNKIDYEALR